MKTLLKPILFMGVFLAPQILSAEQLYLDIGVGNANIEIDDLDGDDTYLKIGLGYKVNDTISIEGGFWDAGEAEDGPFSLAGDGIFGNVKAGTQLNNNTELFGRIGLFMWDSETCVAGLGCASDDGTDMFFGGGVSFAVGSGRLNAEIHFMDVDDADVTTIGGSYSIPFN